MPGGSRRLGGAGSCFQKCRTEYISFVELFEDFIHRFPKETVELMTVTARRIWLRRNTLVFEGDFRHPSEVFEGAVAALEDFNRCNSTDLNPGDDTNDIQTSRQLRWHPPPDDFIKINWDAAINEKERCIGLGIVARDSMGEFMGAKSIMKPIVVEARLAEAMAALLAVLYGKEAGFQKIVYEGDACHATVLGNKGNVSSSTKIIKWKRAITTNKFKTHILIKPFY
jgi:hypothetical protein